MWPKTLTHTHAQLFNGLWSGTTRVGRYQKKHSPTHTHPDHRTSFINFLHLLWSIASSVFSLRAWQSFLTTSLQILFGLSLGLGPFSSYFMHFFTQSSSAFRSTCPYHRSLFCCNTNAMSSTPNLSHLTSHPKQLQDPTPITSPPSLLDTRHIHPWSFSLPVPPLVHLLCLSVIQYSRYRPKNPSLSAVN